MQSVREQLQGYAETKRAELITGANNGDDDDLPPEERPNRATVATGCRLKPYDEVEIYGIPMIYLCPGRGAMSIYAICIDGATIPLGAYDVGAVTDRIPYDPMEEPLPIFEET